MNGMVPLLLNLIAAGLVVMMLYQGMTRRAELFSYRNIYLVGYIMFLLVGLSGVIASRSWNHSSIEHPDKAIELLLIYNVVYLSIFLLSYHRLRLADSIVRWFTPKKSFEANDWTLLLIGLGFTVLAVFMRFVGGRLPVLDLMGFFTPFAPAACGLVGWVWGGRRFNLAVIVLGGLIFVVCIFLSVYGIPSRRPLIAICASIAWGAWYRKGNKVNPVKLIAWALPVMLLAAYFVGGWTRVRHIAQFEGKPVEAIQRMLTMPPTQAIGAVFKSPEGTWLTLWALDAYPSRVESRHLFSFRYMLYHPIPRRLWPTKPEPLSRKVSRLARLHGVNHKVITLPPGVVGYAQAEGGAYALVLYALFFGQMMRFFDELLRRNPSNPFLIIATGCTLGQVIGLARGDIAIMANLITLGFLTIWVMLLLSRMIIGRSQPSSGITPLRY